MFSKARLRARLLTEFFRQERESAVPLGLCTKMRMWARGMTSEAYAQYGLAEHALMGSSEQRISAERRRSCG